jgi:hypothetical protein
LDIEVAATAPVDGELAACVDGKLFNAAVTKAPGDIELTAEAGAPDRQVRPKPHQTADIAG